MVEGSRIDDLSRGVFATDIGARAWLLAGASPRESNHVPRL